MFLLRCAFWLSIVFASMSWGEGALRSPGLATSVGVTATTLRAAADRSLGGISAFCKDREAACLRDAARLTALVDTTLQPVDRDDVIVQDRVIDPPLPPPAPRRRAAASMLTRHP